MRHFVRASIRSLTLPLLTMRRRTQVPMSKSTLPRLVLALLLLTPAVQAQDAYFRMGVSISVPSGDQPPDGSANDLPLEMTASGVPSGSLEIGTMVDAAFVATGGGGPRVFSIQGNSGGLSISQDGNLTGTLLAAGPYDFVVDVASYNAHATFDVSFTVLPALGGLAVNSAPGASVVAGSAYSATLGYSGAAALGSFGLPSQSTLPTLTFTQSGSSVIVSGTVPASGPLTYTLTATDVHNRPVAPLTVSHTVIPALSASYAPVSGYPGSVSATPVVTGGTAPYGFSSLNLGSIATVHPTTGTITLAAGQTEASSASYSVTVTDSASRSVTIPVSVAVVLPPLPVFANLTGQVAGTQSQSSIQLIPGAGTITVSISGGSFQVCSDSVCNSVVRAYGPGAYNVSAGQYVGLAVTAPAVAGNTAAVTLTVGGRSVTWTSTTYAPVFGVTDTLAAMRAWLAEYNQGDSAGHPRTADFTSPPSGFTYSGGLLRNPWGQRAIAAISGSDLIMAMDNVPPEACKEMVPFSGRTGPVGSGIAKMTFYDSTTTNNVTGDYLYSIDAAQAEAICSGGNRNIYWYFY